MDVSVSTTKLPALFRRTRVLPTTGVARTTHVAAPDVYGTDGRSGWAGRHGSVFGGSASAQNTSIPFRCSTDWPLVTRIGPTEVGTIEPYREAAGVAFHDLSGAASDGNVVVFVDDGSTAADFNFVRALVHGSEPRDLPLEAQHRDIEDVTYDGKHFVLATSLSADLPEQSKVTRFSIAPGAASLRDQQSVDLRAPLLAAMSNQLAGEWFDRVKVASPKAGGLNLEGVAADLSAHESTLVLGLRSPLFGPGFGDPAAGPDFSLDSGAALLAFVRDPFGTPSFDFHKVDLGGHGVRGMEYIPKLDGFVIIGGPVPKADGYSLWLYRPDEGLSKLDVPGFDELRRPESVMQVNDEGRDYLVVLSEQSGEACANAPFNFIRAELQTTASRKAPAV